MAVRTIIDTFDVCMEELALSGLEGAPPELLWIRLQQRLEDLVLTERYKECFWDHFVLLSGADRGSKVSFSTTPEPVPINNVFQDSYWHHDVISHKQRLFIPPPNSWRMVKDDKLNIWGCCGQYEERTDVTQLVIDSFSSYADAMDRFGDKLVLVASQAIREFHLTPPMTDPGWMKWTPKDYSLLELVGKSRNFGIMRHILNTSFAAEQKGMKAFHLIKSLKKLGFLILEEVNYMNEGHLINATQIRLIKYKNSSSATNLFQNKDKLGIIHFLDGLEGKSATRKVLRTRYGTDVLENLLSKGVISRSNEGDKQKYKLVTPISQVSEELLDNESTGDEDSSDEEDKEESEDIPPNRMISYHRDRTLFLQCYKAIHAAGPNGVHLQDVVRSLPLNHLISRRVPISLEDAGLVVSKLEDQQHPKSKKLIRKFRLIASCYLKGGKTKNLDFNTHKTKQPAQKKSTRQQPPNQSRQLEFSTNVGSLSPSSSPQQPTHSRAHLPKETIQYPEHIPSSETPENSRQSWVSEEHTEDPSSELLELQEDLSLSEYSDPEADIPVVSLEQLKQERGGEMFPEEETREFLELLSERFGFTDLEVKLCYVEPEKQARKLSCTQLYERRKSDVLEYFQQKRVVIDLVRVKAFLQSRDSIAGVKYKLDSRTLFRFLSQLQIEGYLHRFVLGVTSGGRKREDRVYLYYGESLTSLRMLNKCEGLLIRLTDKISWKGRTPQPSQSPATHRSLTPALPKFQKLRALHIYLYLLANGPDIEFDKIKELPYSWLNKVRQLTDTEEHGPGWINAAIALRCIPFSLFYALNTQAREYQELLTDPIRDILSDPGKRDLPKARVNIDKLGGELTRLKRHYSTRYREMLLQLYEIGAIEIEGYTKPGINRVITLHLNLETVYLYIKPTLKLIDTSRETRGSRHSYFSNEAREVLPTYSIQLDTVADLDYYWLMANIISNNSKIVIKIESRNRNRREEDFSLPIEEDGKLDFKKLDSVGFSAAGFPPSLHSNYKRNWSGIFDPIDPAICHFNFRCHSLAYKATNIFSLEISKMTSKISSIIPHPKVLVSQKTVLMKLRTRGKSVNKRKKTAVGKKVPFFSCNMLSFVRANFRAPEEAGLTRKSLTRCSHWSREESNKLLLCYIASVTLIKLLGKQVPTMVCIMSVLEKTSRDKTTSAIRRHLRMLMKKTPMLYTYCDNSIRELYNAMKTENLEDITFETVYTFTKDNLSDSPAAVMRGEMKQQPLLLPSSVKELLEKYCINTPNNFGFKAKVETERHTNEDSIKLFMLQDMILSTVSLYAGTNFESYTVYLMYNKFSSLLLKQVVAALKQNYILGRNKEEGSGDMRYKIKFITQSRLSDSYPPSCVLEPQLIPYSLADIPLYSHDPDSSQSLVTTLTEEFMLASTADLYSFLKHVHSQPNNFRMEIELPYNVSKTGESSPQFPLYFLDRSAGRKPDTGESLSELRCPEIELEQEQEAEGKKEKLLSISKYFGVEKTHVMKCADIVTLAVSDPWSTVEFETRELPPHFPSYPLSEQSADSSAGMSWEVYARLVREHCRYSKTDIEISKSLFEEISEHKMIGAREIDLIQECNRRGSQYSTEVLVQNLVNFKLVMRAGTTESCLVAREYSEIWQHPIIGLDSLESVDNVRSTLTQECITCFRPWIGLVSSGLVWNTTMLNQLTRSVHCYIVMNTGVSEVAVLHYFNGFCQLRHLRDILQTLVDSGFIRRTLLEGTGGETVEGKIKPTLLSTPPAYRSRQVWDISNRDPACVFYEGIPGKDISGSELMLEQQHTTN